MWHALHCTNPMCNDNANHCNLIHLFHKSIIDKCITSSELCIPYTSNKSDCKCNIAGLNDLVNSYKEASIFWHNIWKQCGAAHSAVIANVTRQSQEKYHSVVKNVKCDQTAIKQTKLAQSLLNNNTRSFWNEVRNANKKCNATPTMIDG